jgi:hypothetical protein
MILKNSTLAGRQSTEADVQSAQAAYRNGGVEFRMSASPRPPKVPFFFFRAAVVFACLHAGSPLRRD